MTVVQLPKANRAKAAAIPGAYWDAGANAFLLDTDLNPSGAQLARNLFPEIRDQIPAPDSGPPQSYRPIDLATAWAKDQTVNELLPWCDDWIASKLYRYQQIDLGYIVARMRKDGGGYLGWDRGLGKTLGAITVAQELLCDSVVVVCPNQSKEMVWLPEVRKWTRQHDDAPSVYVVKGSKAAREQAIKTWRSYGGYLLIHYEALRLVDPSSLKCDLVIVDESHRLANGRSGTGAPKFYQALMKIKSTYRLALSGSIITNSAEDFYGALHWLFPTRYRSKWRDWCDRYLIYQHNGFARTLVGPDPRKIGSMRQELAAFMVVRIKEDELEGLPAITTQHMRVELSPSQRKVYDKLAKDFIAELPDGSSLTAPNVAVALIRLRQVATGMELLDKNESRDPGFVDSTKLEAAEEIIEATLPNKIVVFCWHRATVDALAYRLRGRGIKNVSCVSGGTPMSKRTQIVADFTDGDTNVLIATIKTLGESVNLQSAADLVFIESSWTAADMDQARDRVYRNGQTRPVTVTHIIAADTVDETHVMPKVADKAALRRVLLGGRA